MIDNKTARGARAVAQRFIRGEATAGNAPQGLFGHQQVVK
jgi:hypothetical protein